jgi:hypothetical protein
MSPPNPVADNAPGTRFRDCAVDRRDDVSLPDEGANDLVVDLVRLVPVRPQAVLDEVVPDGEQVRALASAELGGRHPG